MTASDSKQAIIEYISQPLSKLEVDSPWPAGVQLPERPPLVRKGGGLGAKSATVRFLQERSLPDRRLHLVAFENEAGQSEQWLFCVLQDTLGHWQGVGSANIGNVEEEPKRGYPWVNLAGGWRKDLFWAGGRIQDPGVVRVRLISGDGIALEDSVQDGLVLFVSKQGVQRPLRVELYDRSGNLVGTHQALPWKPPQ